MILSSLEAKITWLNVYPKKNEIPRTLIPITVVSVTPNIYANHTTLQPVSYAYCNIKGKKYKHNENKEHDRIYIEDIK